MSNKFATALLNTPLRLGFGRRSGTFRRLELEPGAGPRILRVTPASDGEWEEAWRDCSYSTFFHSPEWARLWSDYAGKRVRPSPQLVMFSDGKRALLPLSFEHRAGGLLSRYASSPQGTYGGWLSADDLELPHALLLMDWLTRSQRYSLVWRLNPYEPLAFRAGMARNIQCKRDETHALRLTSNPEEVFRRFKATFRSQIKKAAARAEFSIEPASTLDDWRAYFEIYQDSQRRWGEDPAGGHAWSLFELFFRLESPHVKLWLARRNGRVVSGDLCLYAKKHVAYWHGATLHDELASNVAKLLKHEIIKDACTRGFSWFDFNPSAGLDGVKFFKQGFNCEELPAPIVYIDTPLKRLARSCAAAVRVQYAGLALQPLQVGAGGSPAP